MPRSGAKRKIAEVSASLDEVQEDAISLYFALKEEAPERARAARELLRSDALHGALSEDTDEPSSSESEADEESEGSDDDPFDGCGGCASDCPCDGVGCDEDCWCANPAAADEEDANDDEETEESDSDAYAGSSGEEY